MYDGAQKSIVELQLSVKNTSMESQQQVRDVEARLEEMNRMYSMKERMTETLQAKVKDMAHEAITLQKQVRDLVDDCEHYKVTSTYKPSLPHRCT